MNGFETRLSATPSEVSEVQAVDTVFSQLKTFSMRWRPMLQASSQAWSRATCVYEHMCGSLEVQLPYFIIRGFEAVSEVSSFMKDEYLTYVFGT